MRILLLTPFVPHAGAAHGGAVYLAGLLPALARHAEVGLVALADPGDAAAAVAPPGVAWFAPVPLPRSGPGASLSDRARILWLWRRLPLVAAKHWQGATVAALRRARAEWRPDAVLIELAQMAQYLPWLDDVPTILTDHEAGCPANTRTGLGASGDRRDQALWRRYVEHFYPLASRVQAVTDEDAGVLSRQLGIEVVCRAAAFPVPASPVAPERAPPRALFAGDYSHAPNPEAARRLVRDVLPLLRARAPAAELWFAGRNLQHIADLDGTPGVRLVGFVPELATLFGQVRLLLAPVWSGGGFRMKCVAALAHGLPVVTNALGARGCGAPAAARIVAEEPDALAAAAASWLAQPALAAAAGRAAHAWAQAHLSADAIAATQLQRVRELVGRQRPA